MLKKKETSTALQGKKIVLTRSKKQNRELRQKIESQGGEVLELPLIHVSPFHHKEVLEDVFAELGSYEWFVFTSVNGVKYFFELFFDHFKDVRSIGGARIACVGTSTALQIRKIHLQVDYIPQKATAENLAKGLLKLETLDNLKILVITGNLNSDALVKILTESGNAIVDTLQVYETKATDLKNNVTAKSFRESGADAIVFASSSAVDSFVKQAGFLKLEAKAKRPMSCSIGPSTSETMKKRGMPVDMEAAEASIEGILEVLRKGLGSKVL